MPTFRSEIFPTFFSEKFDYGAKNLLIGSCFTENIGKKLCDSKFPVLVNPFGIVYNPLSVAKSLELILNHKVFSESDLHYFNEKWISFLHHGKFSSTNSDEALRMINDEVFKAHEFLLEGSVLFITFGTSWVYKYKETNQIVANCHKIPASEFDHYSVSANEIVEIYCNRLCDIHKLNNKLKIVLTVSPVRHWSNGAMNNQYSKSVLIVAIHELLKKFDYVSYFPAYELMMDDLRDYRFYADDLFHPNQLGIDYIWDKFKECFISQSALDIADKVEKIRKSTLHRPFYPKTQSHLTFIDNNLQAIARLILQFPDMDFSEEISYFETEKFKYF